MCTPLGLDVTAPQAYALVGVAGMLAALCQVSRPLHMPDRPASGATDTVLQKTYPYEVVRA